MGKQHANLRHELNGGGAAASGGVLQRLSRADRLAIVAESLADGAVASDVARRHGIEPQRLFAWRTAARAKARLTQQAHASLIDTARLCEPDRAAPLGPEFVPVV